MVKTRIRVMPFIMGITLVFALLLVNVGITSAQTTSDGTNVVYQNADPTGFKVTAIGTGTGVATNALTASGISTTQMASIQTMLQQIQAQLATFGGSNSGTPPTAEQLAALQTQIQQVRTSIQTMVSNAGNVVPNPPQYPYMGNAGGFGTTPSGNLDQLTAKMQQLITQFQGQNPSLPDLQAKLQQLRADAATFRQNIGGDIGSATSSRLAGIDTAIQRMQDILASGNLGPVATQVLNRAIAALQCIQLNANLGPGSRGIDVTNLQEMLIQRGHLAEGNNTGYFGPLTEHAVQDFQRAQGIVDSGTPDTTGFGFVGPRTRSALAECLQQARQDNPIVVPGATPATTSDTTP